MNEKPYFGMLDQICRSNGWVLGQDKGQVVVGVVQQDGSQQSVVVDEFQDTTGQFAVRLWSPVAPSDKVPPDQALQINAQLPHGALASRDNQVVMTVTRILNMTNQTDLTNLLSVISYYAHFYGQHYGASA